MFFVNGVRDATSEVMGKRDEDSVGGIKILEDNQKYNLEDSHQEQVICKDGLGIMYEKYVQVSKKTSNRDIFQDQNFLIKKDKCTFSEK